MIKHEHACEIHKIFTNSYIVHVNRSLSLLFILMKIKRSSISLNEFQRTNDTTQRYKELHAIQSTKWQ